MAAFYSTIYGNRGEANRCGSKASGILATAQSWEGSVATKLYMAPDGNVHVLITAGKGSTAHPYGRTIYYGPLSALIDGEQ